MFDFCNLLVFLSQLSGLLFYMDVVAGGPISTSIKTIQILGLDALCNRATTQRQQLS